jgi:hypothetical protein
MNSNQRNYPYLVFLIFIFLLGCTPKKEDSQTIVKKEISYNEWHL